MKLIDVTTFPVWEGLTASQSWAVCEVGGFEEAPPVQAWANALRIDFAGTEHCLLVTVDEVDL